MKSLLILSLLTGGLVETIIVPTQDERTCQFVENEIRRAMELPLDPAAAKILDVRCDDEAPEDAAQVGPPEFPL